MTAPVIYEQSDFDSPAESLDQWRSRMFPAPTRKGSLGIVVGGVALGTVVLIGLWVLAVLAS
jgi:hypothetical protein